MAATGGIYNLENLKEINIFWRVHSLTELFCFQPVEPLELYKWGFRSAEHL